MRSTARWIAGMVFFALFIQDGLGWKEHMHKGQLTPLALSLIRLRDQAHYWRELSRFEDYLKQGAWDEDFPANFSGIRANNHYRHALTGRRLSDAPFVGLGDPDADALEWAEKNPLLSPREEFQDGKEWHFRNWGWSAADVDYGNMSWERAVWRYGYTENSKQLAYYTLGFILHLLQDMGCPEHVHDDPHGASGYTGFEWWVYDKWNTLKPDLGSLQVKKFERLRDFFVNLSQIGYSADRFYGGPLDWRKPDAIWDINLGRMFILEYDSSRAEWQMRNPDGTPILRPVVPSSKGSNILNFDFEWNWGDYRKNPLWTKGHDEGEWWPTWRELDGILIDDEGYYYIELSGDLPGDPWNEFADPIRHLYPRAYLPTPLSSVKTQCQGREWAVADAGGQHLYSLIGRAVFPAIVEHTAGLIEHFYDIVNHPPYVESVTATQSGGGGIKAYWMDHKKRAIGKDVVGDIEKREFIQDKDSSVRPGEVLLTVTFSEAVEEVRVRVGGMSLTGTLSGEGNVWVGRLKIDEKGPESETRPISIAAKDRDNHYQNIGSVLDGNPATPARRLPGDSDYEWYSYESGEDRNHALRIRREEKERQDVKDISTPIHIMVNHPSVVYCDGKREDLEISWFAQEKLTYPVRIIFQPHEGWVCPYGGRFSRVNLNINQDQIARSGTSERVSRTIERVVLKGSMFCNGYARNPQAKSFEILYEVIVIDSRGRKSVPKLVPHTCVIQRSK